MVPKPFTFKMSLIFMKTTSVYILSSINRYIALSLILRKRHVWDNSEITFCARSKSDLFKTENLLYLAHHSGFPQLCGKSIQTSILDGYGIN